MIKNLRFCLLVFSFFNSYFQLHSQTFPSATAGDNLGIYLNDVNIANTVYNVCSNSCVNLQAEYLGVGSTTMYEMSNLPWNPPYPLTGGTSISTNGTSSGITDDVWSSVIDIPFNFCFFGNNYNSLVIGSNGLLSFNASYAGNSCPWDLYDDYGTHDYVTIPQTDFPNTSSYKALNAIYAVYEDMLFTASWAKSTSNITYAVYGSAPNRAFVVNFRDAPYFGDDATPHKYTNSQIVIYETTNIVDIFVYNKSNSLDTTPWNANASLVGIQDASGSYGYAPAGRNTGNWTAYHEAYRFTPVNGGPTSKVSIEWLKDGAVVGTDNVYNACVTNQDSQIKLRAKYLQCDGTTVNVEKNLTLKIKDLQVSDYAVPQECTASAQTVDLTQYQTNLMSDVSGVIFSYYPTLADAQANTNVFTDQTAHNINLGTTDVYVKADNGTCQKIAKLTFTLNTPPTATISTYGATATVTATGGTAPYQYSVDGSTWQSSNVFTNLPFGDNEVFVKDGKGCSSGPFAFTVVCEPNAVPSHDGAATECLNVSGDTTVNLALYTDLLVSNASSYTYKYYLTQADADANTSEITDLGNYIVTLGDNVVYVRVIDANGCFSIQKLTITIPVAPEVETVNVVGSTASVTAVNGTQPYSYSLTPSGPWQAQNVFTNLELGDYQVYVKDSKDCLGLPVEFTIKDVDASINVITPNGDGINDVWNVKGIEGFPGSKIKIYNRFGRLIYEATTSVNPVWNGKFGNDPVPSTTYWYILELSDGRKLTGYILVKNRYKK